MLKGVMRASCSMGALAGDECILCFLSYLILCIIFRHYACLNVLLFLIMTHSSLINIQGLKPHHTVTYATIS